MCSWQLQLHTKTDCTDQSTSEVQIFSIYFFQLNHTAEQVLHSIFSVCIKLIMENSMVSDFVPWATHTVGTLCTNPKNLINLLQIRIVKCFVLESDYTAYIIMSQLVKNRSQPIILWFFLHTIWQSWTGRDTCLMIITILWTSKARQADDVCKPLWKNYKPNLKEA